VLVSNYMISTEFLKMQIIFRIKKICLVLFGYNRFLHPVH